MPPTQPLSIAVVAPQREQCGVTDYTRHLLTPLSRLVDVRHVTDADGFTDAMNGVDLAHIQHQYFLFGGVAPWKCRFGRLARRLRVPAVMTVHEFVSPGGPLPRRLAVALSNRLHFGHPAVRRLIVHTEADRERMVAAGLERMRIAVVRHGVPDAPPLPDGEQARRDLGLEGRTVLTLFGFLSRRKGHLLALEALRRLPSDAVLLLAGGRHPDDDTHYVAQVEAAISDAGLGDRARITGYLAGGEVARIMAATHVVLAPFTDASGSGSMALAFACGKPVVASDIAPHREIAADTPGALRLHVSGSAPALHAVVERLLRDADGLADLAAGGRRYAEAHSYAKMAEETVQEYQSLMEDVFPCA